MKINFLNNIEIKDWQIVFCSFLEGKYNLNDFEQYIYKQPILEKELGESLYNNLLSVNYTNENNEKIKKNIQENIFKNTNILNTYRVYSILKDSGISIERISSKNNHIKNVPNSLLDIYGGLEIGETGSGIDQAKSNILFMDKPLVSDLDENWHKVIGDVVQIGMAHNQNIILFMNLKGVMYIYIDILDKMYLGGSFQDSLIKLLLGLNYGKTIVK